MSRFKLLKIKGQGSEVRILHEPVTVFRDEIRRYGHWDTGKASESRMIYKSGYLSLCESVFADQERVYARLKYGERVIMYIKVPVNGL